MATHGTTAMVTPKSMLLGVTLASGWTLVNQLVNTKGATGGTFGVGYEARRGEELAFVKAVDFVDAFNASDPMIELAKLTSIANFEKEVLEYCSSKKMSRVLRYIGHEYIAVAGSPAPLNRVSCLIMEAGTSDLRRLLVSKPSISCAWNLQVLCDVAQAIAQLHQGGIAHQDIKPSNVIAMRSGAINGAQPMKVGDLGRVVRRSLSGPFDGHEWPGDMRYSPPERWYQHVPADWVDARDAADAYMLGSLLVFLFTGASVQALLVPKLPSAFQPGNWRGGYNQDLIPVLVNAHARLLVENLAPQLISDIRDPLMNIARELTHPDPRRRGDPRARRQIDRPVGLDRIHQRLRALAVRSAAIERGRRP